MFGILDGIYSFTTTVNTSRTTSYTTSWTTSWKQNRFYPFVTDTTLWENYSLNNGAAFYVDCCYNGNAPENFWWRIEVSPGYNVASHVHDGLFYERQTYRAVYDQYGMIIYQYDYNKEEWASRTTSKTTSRTTSFTTSFEEDFYA